VNLPAEPEKWACLACGITTVSGKAAGALLVFLRTHGEGVTNPSPKPGYPQYSVEMKFIKMSASVAAAFRRKYELLSEAGVSPEHAGLFRIGYDTPASADCADGHPGPALLDWLNDQKATELISAPRITLAPKTDCDPPELRERLFKIVLRNPGQSADNPDKTEAGQHFFTMLGEFTPRLVSFLKEHEGKRPGIIADATSEYYFDKERDELLRYSYGNAAAVALELLPDTDLVQTTVYWNMKTKEEHGRGLFFWKQPPPPTFHEFPAELTHSFHDRECIGLLRPYEDSRTWLLYTACVTRVDSEGRRSVETK
jgi:hypothetical protein